LCLAEQAAQAVFRQDLLDKVCGATLVNEESITRAVFQLRKILADDPQQPRYIETIRKGGYRLVAPIRELAPRRKRPTIRRLAWIVPLAAVAVAVAVRVTWLPNGRALHPAGTPLRPRPFTSDPGLEVRPSLSPDGTRVAFAWSGPAGGRTAIYIKQPNNETPLQLSDEPGW
ncbi:MAG: hypothetical protein GY778_20115, partial [bacterium]|nr:hypothetical protein [bacterium]